MGTVANLKTRLAAYLNVAVSDLTVTGVDLGLDAVNSAHTYAQLQHDFEFAKVALPYTVHLVTGGVLTPASYGGESIAVKKVLQPWGTDGSGNAARPLHFEQRSSMVATLSREWASRPWDFRFADPPWSVSNSVLVPTVVQIGQQLFLYPADRNTWGTDTNVGLVIDVVRLYPEYVDPRTDTDFLLEFGNEFMFWYALQHLNMKYKEFVPRQEGNLEVSYLEKKRDESWSDLLAWDANIVLATDALSLD